MITFTGGPAEGKQLRFVRCPLMLRVVVNNRTGEVDALNEVADVPKNEESIVVYRCDRFEGTCHVSCRPRSQSYWSSIAHYTLLPKQPAEMLIRFRLDWERWCDENKEALMKGVEW